MRFRILQNLRNWNHEVDISEKIKNLEPSGLCVCVCVCVCEQPPNPGGQATASPVLKRGRFTSARPDGRTNTGGGDIHERTIARSSRCPSEGRGEGAADTDSGVEQLRKNGYTITPQHPRRGARVKATARGAIQPSRSTMQLQYACIHSVTFLGTTARLQVACSTQTRTQGDYTTTYYAISTAHLRDDNLPAARQRAYIQLRNERCATARRNVPCSTQTSGQGNDSTTQRARRSYSIAS